MNERLAPEGFRKIAENTNQQGISLAAVFHKQDGNKFFIQMQNDEGNAHLGIGPISAHVFENLIHVMSDIKDMEKRYLPLE